MTALRPKLPGMCAVCDTEVREVAQRNPDGTPVSLGRRLPGSRVAHLVHFDGSTSDHSLCPTCTVEPADLTRLWTRVLLAYAGGITESQDPRWNEKYAQNRPLEIGRAHV